MPSFKICGKPLDFVLWLLAIIHFEVLVLKEIFRSLISSKS